MALVPCKVCGTLNSEEVDICLSCEYPIRGRRRPILFQWAAILLFSLFTVPLINFALGAIRANQKPKRSLNSQFDGGQVWQIRQKESQTLLTIKSGLSKLAAGPNQVDKLIQL